MILAWRDWSYTESLIWWANGGSATLRYYSRGDQILVDNMLWQPFLSYRADGLHAAACGLIPNTHWHFFESCRNWYETDNHIFVHAGSTLSWVLTGCHATHCTRFHRESRPHKSGKKVICAHTPSPPASTWILAMLSALTPIFTAGNG